MDTVKHLCLADSKSHTAVCSLCVRAVCAYQCNVDDVSEVRVRWWVCGVEDVMGDEEEKSGGDGTSSKNNTPTPNVAVNRKTSLPNRKIY